jgi:hypothetical protein
MRTLNTIEDVSEELRTSEENLKRLRNLLQETESNIFAEGAYIRYLKYRLSELKRKAVSNDTDNQTR